MNMRTGACSCVALLALAIFSSVAGAEPAERGQGRASCAASVKKIYGRSPVYPAEAIKQHQEGTVALIVLIDDQGKPIGARIARTSGSPSLDESALQASRAWTFDATACIRPGSGETITIGLPVTFHLPTEAVRRRRPDIEAGSWGKVP
jgi:TonB family protein